MRCKLNKELHAMSKEVLGLGMIAFKDGAEVYSYFDGRRHVKPDKPMTRKTLLRAASLSKMFVAFSIMQLVEQGKLNLLDDVSDYLGFELRNPNFHDTPITIEMLADHTSSLRDGKIYSLPPHCSLKEFFTAGGVAYEDGAHFAKVGTPGKYFHYCNLNYGVLGTVIERVTGERFDLYQRAHVLDPLGIGGGYVVSNFDAKTFAQLGTLYIKAGDWIAQLDDYKVQPPRNFISVQNPYAPDAYGSYSLDGYDVGTNATIFAPPGGLRISFEDLAKALQMMMKRGAPIISEESFDAMISPHWTFDAANPNGYTFGGVMENYGLGTYKIGGTSKARLCKDYAIDLIGHSGEAFGLISGLYFVPHTQDGVIFMIDGATLTDGEFSASYLLEEQVMNPVCKYILRSGRDEIAAV